jgi:hypothetical protein
LESERDNLREATQILSQTVHDQQDKLERLRVEIERITRTDGSSAARDIARAALNPSQTITGKLHR